MLFQFSTQPAEASKADALVVPVFEGLSTLAKYAYGKTLKKRINAKLFNGEQQSLFFLPSSGDKLPDIVLVGLGKQGDFTPGILRDSICAAVRDDSLSKLKAQKLALDMSVLIKELADKKSKAKQAKKNAKTPASLSFSLGQAACEGAGLGVYVYDKLFSQYKDKKVPDRPKNLTFHTSRAEQSELKKGVELGKANVSGVNLCRDLCNDPNSHLKPADLARKAQQLARKIPGLRAKVLSKQKLKELKMGAFLSVNHGSDNADGAARLICLEYFGGKKNQAPLCFVGKGITFDTGGYNLKPSAGILGMKWDMGGAATVLGAITAIAEAKIPVNAVALIPTTENLINENATKPGDVVRSMSGLTIEVNNTDAEGRLILCDTLTYAQKTYKPDTIIDLATLTGAVLVALGDQYFAVLANDDGVAQELDAATQSANELSWRLPLPEEYDRYLDSKIADLSNIGGRYAGTITAGLFLQRFIDKGQKWAHLDIAGVADNTSGNQRGVAPPHGGTGTAVRTLVAFAEERSKS